MNFDLSAIVERLGDEVPTLRQIGGAAVHHRQRAGIGEAHRAYLCVRRRPERRGAAAEHLRLRQEPRMHFQSDDRLPRHSGDYRSRVL